MILFASRFAAFRSRLILQKKQYLRMVIFKHKEALDFYVQREFGRVTSTV